MTITIYLLLGLGLLYFGAEWLVRGGSNVALRSGISPLVIGLTIVAFGTSMPELVVSIRAGYRGLGDIAIGNVVGSNIFNIAVILGASAVLRPLKVNTQVLKIDTPIMVAVSLVLWGMLSNGAISRIEGLFLFTGIVVYTILTIYFGNKSAVPVSKTEASGTAGRFRDSVIFDILLILVGLALLIFGSHSFIKGAIDLARFLNVSEAVIGLTIVAAGTSLPELATSVVAAVKGEEDIAIGNIVGSNIFNILAILGLSDLITPLTSQGIRMIDLALMTGTAVLLLPLMRTGFRLSRTEGIFLILIYGGYLWYLWPK